MIKERTYEALKIIRDNRRIYPMRFAQLFWKDNRSLFTKMSNSGNGAVAGKAAWLCAGSFVAKLKKRGFVWVDCVFGTEYIITQEGNKAIEEYEREQNKSV